MEKEKKTRCCEYKTKKFITQKANTNNRGKQRERERERTYFSKYVCKTTVSLMLTGIMTKRKQIRIIRKGL